MSDVIITNIKDAGGPVTIKQVKDALVGWWMDPDALVIGWDYHGLRAKCTSREALEAAWRLLTSDFGPVVLFYAGNVVVDVRQEHLRNGGMIPL